VYTPAVVPALAQIPLVAQTLNVVEPDVSSTGTISVAADHSAHVTAQTSQELSQQLTQHETSLN